MAKFDGLLGFVQQQETSPGVWTDVTTEKQYYGEVNRDTRRLQQGEKLNDDVVVNNLVSVVSDPFADGAIMAIRYVVWRGIKWKINSIDVQSPRIILSIREQYNG
jgi:hypothetical protein